MQQEHLKLAMTHVNIIESNDKRYQEIIDHWDALDLETEMLLTSGVELYYKSQKIAHSYWISPEQIATILNMFIESLEINSQMRYNDLIAMGITPSRRESYAPIELNTSE